MRHVVHTILEMYCLRHVSAYISTFLERINMYVVHGVLYIVENALVLKCLCIDAVLERNGKRVDDESIQM